MTICIKDALEERVSFNGNIKIIYASIKYSKDAPTQEKNSIFTEVKYTWRILKNFQISALTLLVS